MTLDITEGHGQPQPAATGGVQGDTPQGQQLAAPARPRLGPEDWRATQEIAVQLGETARGALGQVGRVVGRLGADRARTLLARTQEIEAAGGLMLPDGSRRRTPGGVFFHLVRADDTLTREDRAYIFPSQSGRKKAAGHNVPPTPAAIPAAWADNDYRHVMAVLQHETGRATTVKITVIGRPGAAVEQGQAVAVALTNEKVPSLPKGLPEPAASTRYTVFVARKQWAKVTEEMVDLFDAASRSWYGVDRQHAYGSSGSRAERVASGRRRPSHLIGIMPALGKMICTMWRRWGTWRRFFAPPGAPRWQALAFPLLSAPPITR